MNAQLVSRFLSLCLLSLVAGNDTKATTSDESQPKVGWVAGPTQRGTLILVYGCLSTMFASTWTVLHLNIPAPEDKWWEKALRKTKWMAITVLFPEFIFSKAVCELRLAVADLYSMHVALESAQLQWIEKVPNPYVENGRINLTLIWDAKFGRRMKILYRLLGLGETPEESEQRVARRPDNANETSSIRSNENGVQARNLAEDTRSNHSAETEAEISGGIGDNAADPTISPQHEENTTGLSSASISNEQPSNQRVPKARSLERVKMREKKSSPDEDTHIEERHWTLVHSFYANMGGMRYTDHNVFDHERMTFPLTTQLLVSEITNGDPSKDLLKELTLSKEDIEDKSKADWLLKAIAISQITWLILNVLARHIAKVPITQLEIATVAFSLMAITTYAANWWKPKDVTSSTVLGRKPYWFTEGERDFRSFIDRLLTPSHSNFVHFLSKRITNDMIRVEGQPPIILLLMAGSSLMFGGFHCLAWNFDFPSKAELVLWRVASITSATLPGISLGISLVIHFFSTTYVDERRMESVLNGMAPLNQFPDAWWNLLAQRPSFQDWPWQSWITFRSILSQHPSDMPNWEEAPAMVETLPENERIARNDRSTLGKVSQCFVEIGRCWIKTKGDSNWSDDFETLEYYAMYPSGVMFEDNKKEERELAVKQWRGYERYLRTRPEVNGYALPAFCTLDFIIGIGPSLKELERKSESFKGNCDLCSRFLTISMGTLYTISRVVILVLLFTSLRSAPEGVYDNTQWTRFLPNIS